MHVKATVPQAIPHPLNLHGFLTGVVYNRVSACSLSKLHSLCKSVCMACTYKVQDLTDIGAVIIVCALQAGEDVAAINNHLKKYPAAIDNFIDVWMVVKVGDPNFVYEWRLEAEHKLKSAGKSGMTDDQVADFVDRYMPGYIHYLPGLYSQGPTTKQPGKVLTIQVDKSRQLTQEQPEQYVHEK